MATKRRNTGERAKRLMESLRQQYPDPTAVLYRAHSKLVNLARGYGVDNEELLSLCWLGAAKAAAKFRNDGGARFTTYAVMWMRSEVSRELRLRVRASHRPKHMAIDGTGEDGTSLTESIPAKDGGYSREAFYSAVEEVVYTKLPPVARDAVASMFGMGVFMSEDQLCQKYRLPVRVLRSIREHAVKTVKELTAASE